MEEDDDEEAGEEEEEEECLASLLGFSDILVSWYRLFDRFQTV